MDRKAKPARKNGSQPLKENCVPITWRTRLGLKESLLGLRLHRVFKSWASVLG